MKKLALQKIAMLIATLALGSGCIANDALARGDVGINGGGTGAGRFNGVRADGQIGQQVSFLYGDYENGAKGFECLENARRSHQCSLAPASGPGDGTCY